MVVDNLSHVKMKNLQTFIFSWSASLSLMMIKLLKCQVFCFQFFDIQTSNETQSTFRNFVISIRHRVFYNFSTTYNLSPAITLHCRSPIDIAVFAYVNSKDRNSGFQRMKLQFRALELEFPRLETSSLNGREKSSPVGRGAESYFALTFPYKQRS